MSELRGEQPNKGSKESNTAFVKKSFAVARALRGTKQMLEMAQHRAIFVRAAGVFAALEEHVPDQVSQTADFKVRTAQQSVMRQTVTFRTTSRRYPDTIVSLSKITLHDLHNTPEPFSLYSFCTYSTDNPPKDGGEGEIATRIHPAVDFNDPDFPHPNKPPLMGPAIMQGYVHLKAVGEGATPEGFVLDQAVWPIDTTSILHRDAELIIGELADTVYPPQQPHISV